MKPCQLLIVNKIRLKIITSNLDLREGLKVRIFAVLFEKTQFSMKI